MIESSPVLYTIEPHLDAAQFRRVLLESGLGATRPVDDDARLRAMLKGANLILTARLNQPDHLLVGVARCITDFVWCCYLPELAVCAAAQGLGVGSRLLTEARKHLGPSVSIILISVPEAIGFYEHVGMTRVPNTFWYRRDQ